MPINPASGHFSTSQYKSTVFEAKIACIENITKIQHRQLNYQSHTYHNYDMLIKTFDLWWLKLPEVPPNPASIPSATSLAREWLARAIISHSILTLTGWWAGRQGFQTGTAGWLCYQGQFSCMFVSLLVLEGSDWQTPTAPLWPGSDQLDTLWWAGKLISLVSHRCCSPHSWVAWHWLCGIDLAECLLIIGMGYQVFSLILTSPVGWWAGIQCAGKSVSEMPGFESWFYLRKTSCLLVIRNRFPVPIHNWNKKQICIYTTASK